MHNDHLYHLYHLHHLTRRDLLRQCGLGLGGIALCFLLLGCATVKGKDKDKDKDTRYAVPEGLEYFPGVRRIELDFSKPVNRPGEGYQVIRLVQLTSGEIVAPRIIVGRPRKAFFGRIKTQRKWENVLVGVGGAEPGLTNLLFLPTGKRIKSYVFLVRSLDSLDEKTPTWSVWQFEPKDIRKNDAGVDVMKLPKLSDLNLLKTRKDEATIQKIVETATKFDRKTEPWLDD